jgi:hypothetical protein
MNGRDIGERFIRAVEISMWSFSSVGPRMPSRAAWIEFSYTQADKNGWGTERLAEERKDFWNVLVRTPTAREISEAEETQEWLIHVPDERERRALSAWAWCAARKDFFQDWCRKEGIHPETGRRRKERAILRILLAFDCKALQHNEIDVYSLLPDEPKSGHKTPIIAEGATAWMAQNGQTFLCDFDSELGNFEWAEKQNARRREREKQRRKAA